MSSSEGAGPSLQSAFLKRLPHPSRVLGGRVGSGQEHHTALFSPARGPLRFDLDSPFHPCCIVNKAAPFPILWSLHQSSPHWIAMNVVQLLDALLFRPYLIIVVADLPKAWPIRSLQLSRGDLFQHLDDHRQSRALRFTDEQVHVLRHHDISSHIAAVPDADSLEFSLESFFCCGRIQQPPTLAAAEGDEVQTALVLVSNRFDVHSCRL